MTITDERVEVSNPYGFIFGGNARFSIVNTKSGVEHKYHVKVSKDNRNLYYVHVKVESSYVYAGYILMNEDGTFTFRQGKKGHIEPKDPIIRGLYYAAKFGKDTPLPKPMAFWHHGYCACCGRKLDDRISINRGVGPVCWKSFERRFKRNVEHDMFDETKP